eukprot:scaffold118421_cov38-Phaeocystis_antarctica.AAC.1
MPPPPMPPPMPPPPPPPPPAGPAPRIFHVFSWSCTSTPILLRLSRMPSAVTKSRPILACILSASIWLTRVSSTGTERSSSLL